MSTKQGKQTDKQGSRGPGFIKTSETPRYGPSHWPTPQASPFHQRKVTEPNVKPEVPDFASNSALGSAPAQDEPDKNKYPCTFKGCGSRFANRHALNKHKDSEHDYCMKCDLDFKDEEAFYVHKMSTAAHIMCPICDQDFGSEPGRDRHTKQMHAAQQNVQCRACHRKFAKGAGLLLHFEQNQCKTIKANNNPDMIVDQGAMLEAHRAMMALELHNREGKGPSEKKLQSQAPSISATESIDGGVRISTSLLDDPEGEHEFQGMIGLQSPVFPSNSSTSQQSDTASVASTIRENGPESVCSSSNWSKKLFPGAENTPVTGEWATASETAASVKSSRTDLNSVTPSESGINFIDQGKRLEKDPFDGLYHCSFQSCGYKCMVINDMIAHLQEHRGIRNQCPSCAKVFKKPSHLAAHMESSSFRCKIRYTQGYGNALTLVSGGFLGLSGRSEDGTAQIDSNKKPDSFW